MNALEELLVDTSKNIVYNNLSVVDLDEKGKPKRSWMKDWTQEERTAKFFEFCRAYDQREDSLLRENYQQFSHRLHWHECPFVEKLAKCQEPETLLHACILFSFTNEHWLTFNAWADGYITGLQEYMQAGNRPCRSDLFQIYYPKGTIVEEWLLTGPQKAARAVYKSLGSMNRPYTMMEFAKLLNEHFITEQGFRNAMYPCKNAARHVAMSHPEWVDPESFLHGGTGFFDGLTQVFDCPNYMSKAKYDLDIDGEYLPMNKHCLDFVEKMDYLAAHPDNPIMVQKYLNLEDKLCFFYKHIAITSGVKHTTKQIPYEWVYPREWSLKTNQYDRLTNVS
jgi:hypothetical protein